MSDVGSWNQIVYLNGRAVASKIMKKIWFLEKISQYRMLLLLALFLNVLLLSFARYCAQYSMFESVYENLWARNVMWKEGTASKISEKF